MADTKITDLTEKAIGDALDEFVINDVTNGDLDRKMDMAGLRILQSQVTDFTLLVKDADETISSDTTLSNDADFTISVESGDRFVGFGVVTLISPAAADFKYDFTQPGATVARKLVSTLSFAAAGTTNSMGADAIVTTSGSEQFLFIGFYEEFSAAGTLAWRWAQNVSNAGDTTVKANSYFILRKLN